MLALLLRVCHLQPHQTPIHFKMASTIVLITGGNRGLGQGLVTRFLAQPNQVSTSARTISAIETDGAWHAPTLDRHRRRA